LSFEWKASLEGAPVSLVVRADPFGHLVEVSEENNDAVFSVRIRPSALPNLSLSGADISLSPDPPLEGQPATVTAVVRNPSAVDVGSVSVSFSVGDPDGGGTTIGERTLAVPAHSSATVALAWSPSRIRGEQGLFVVGDPLGQVAEYDETDNRAFRPFAVTGLPDLVLTTGAISLTPGFPRAGEDVTLHIEVRNLGAQPSAECLLRAFEGDAVDRAIGERTVASLPPGTAQTLEIPWTPSDPPGEKTLTVLVDADSAVPEQDEGNNRARRVVVVQDADLFLGPPYFSPDGDGVQDETTLGYRATGSVTVVVSNSQGAKVRTLASHAAASGSLTWDGRDDNGRLLSDGTYTLTVTGDGGVVLGRVAATLDTNRSPIHDAAGTQMVAVRNLTCALPGGAWGPAWMPAEDEALFLIPRAQAGWDVGLVRVTLDGQVSYIARDAWFAAASFASSDSVAPDGREVLVSRFGELTSVDLVSGARRSLGAADFARWSPAGGLIATADAIRDRDGNVVAQLPNWGQWLWSPDGKELATLSITSDQAPLLQLVRADGTDLRMAALPDWSEDACIPAQHSGASEGGWSWRADGQVSVLVGRVGEDPIYGIRALGGNPYCQPERVLLADRATLGFTPLSWLPPNMPRASDVQWSPDGSRVLCQRESEDQESPVTSYVGLADGSLRLSLIRRAVEVTPRASAAIYVAETCPAKPGGWGHDTYVATTLQNLSAQLVVERLSANTGLRLRGIAADRNLDHYQIDWATNSAPGVWRPVGPAGEAPVVEDVFGVFVPPDPGTYLIRLSVFDRAGNVRQDTRTVSWDRVSALTNLTQSERLISPNGDGVRDGVSFSYLVREPARVEVRIAGPSGEKEGPTIRRLRLDYPEKGSGSFDWDGRDEAGQVVPDGRYTVFIDDLPFVVEVDTTPPSIAWSYRNLRITKKVPSSGTGQLEERIGELTADRLWHVVDPHLRSWSGPFGLTGNQQVFVPDADASGEAIAEAGVLRVKRMGGVPVDRLEFEAEDHLEVLGVKGAQRLSASDAAGNRAELVVSVEPRLFVRAMADCTWFSPPYDPGWCPSFMPPKGLASPPAVLPVVVWFYVVGTAPGSLRFQYRPLIGGAWTETGQGDAWPGFDWWSLTGVPAGVELAGRFVVRAQDGSEVFSDEFGFLIEGAKFDLEARLKQIPGSSLATYVAGVAASASERLSGVKLTVTGRGAAAGFRSEGAMAGVQLPDGRRTLWERKFAGPLVDCQQIPFAALDFEAEVTTESGRVYRQRLPQWRLRTSLPDCSASIGIRQEFPRCEEASPDRVALQVTAVSALPNAVATIERGPADAPTLVASFPVPMDNPDPTKHLLVDVSGLPEGDLPLRGRIAASKDGGDGQVVAESGATTFVDRTPPRIDILAPTDDGQVCVGAGDLVDLAVFTQDHGEVALCEAAARSGEGAWRQLSRPGDVVCRDGGCHGQHAPPERRLSVAPGPAALGWNVRDLADGESTLRLVFCDHAGLKTTAEKRVSLLRDPPTLSVTTVSPRVFSSIGDGVSATTGVGVRANEALQYTVIVRTAGGAVVRTLALKEARPAGVTVHQWDGRDDLGRLVPEGRYGITVEGVNACGLTASVKADVEIDNTPPSLAIVRPATGSTVGPAVDVRGWATDDHFASYALSYTPIAEPASWIPLEGGLHEVRGSAETPEPLGHWDTPVAEGQYTLRLEGTDIAGNRAETRVVVTVGPAVYLDDLQATPPVFSPNGDGRRDTSAVTYRLLAVARVTLEVRDAAGALLRTLEKGERSAGSHTAVWNGTTDAGEPSPEGALTVRIRAEEPGGGGTVREDTASLVLDRTAPTVFVARPSRNACVPRSEAVHGSVADAHLASYVVSATPAQGSSAEVARGAQVRTDADLGPLDLLADGPYTLHILAEDQAENRSEASLPFVVDSVAPVVRIHTPAAGALLRRGLDSIAVTGTATDTNLREWILRFGAGADPASFVEIARAPAGGSSIGLASWDVASLPDGVYTLQLEASDCAGQVSEARATVTLDGTPPEATLTLPTEGVYLHAKDPVQGTASDENLESWTLEWAPGMPAAAYEWSTLASGTAEVREAAFLRSLSLPPDGIHTLRLTVRDHVGLTARALRTFLVDSTPPALPTGLVAKVIKAGAEAGDVQLAWNPNDEPDLAGYRVARGDTVLTATLFVPPAYSDTGRPEGVYRYSVSAEDRAGNVSAPAALDVRVDLTPPLAAILSPQPGAALAGSVTVRGTAFSPDDFGEYRLLSGAGAAPDSWTLVKRSTVPAAASVLGTWTPETAGPYVLALEAEDVSGNVARVTVPVTVDLEAPEAPTMVSIDNVPAAASLTATWNASPSPDVAGYLVYRNDRIANAPGIVLGELKAFLVPAPRYQDDGLPDGKHCYRVIASDGAGNLSRPSNEICRTLENRAPQAVVMAPENGARFEFPVRVVGWTPDLDVAAVQFEVRPHAGGAWVALGGADKAAPFEVTLDPVTLPGPGPYDLRAVATDQGGKTDADPAFVTLTYGDTTPPPMPLDLVARVDGADIALTWSASSAADLAGYLVARDGVRLTDTPTTGLRYADPGVAPGLHRYQVLAVDADGNESPAASGDAVVYALRLADPPFPVVSRATATVTGTGSRQGTTVEVLRAGAPAGSTPGTDGEFEVKDVALQPDGNVLRAQGRDDEGNRSIPSDEIVVISNAAPEAVSDLAGEAIGNDVRLSWTASASADLQGYVIRRDQGLLTGSSRQTEATSVATSCNYSPGPPSSAFDGDAATVWWGCGGSTGWWAVSFPQAVLVDVVTLRFAGGDSGTRMASYRVEALWEGRFIPLVIVRGNAEDVVEHRWPNAFAATALRVVFESDTEYGLFPGLAEVEVSKIDAVPPDTTTFLDPGLTDGDHDYDVRAIDRYGAESPAATLRVRVGEGRPLEAPVLQGESRPDGTTLLTWDHAGALGFVVRRATSTGGPYSVVGRTGDLRSYTDADLAQDADYFYVVTAFDVFGDESPVSNEIGLRATRTRPPPAPLIFFPTDAAHPLALAASRSDVRGAAESGSLVMLDVNGRTVATGLADRQPLAVKTTSTPAIPDAVIGAVSPDGRTLALVVDQGDGSHLTLVDVDSGATRVIAAPEGREPGALTFSPDNRQLACIFVASEDGGAGAGASLVALDLATDAAETLFETAGELWDARWSPDGRRLAFVHYPPGAGGAELLVRDAATGSVQSVAAAETGEQFWLRWSPDGSRIAFFHGVDGRGTALRTIELATAASQTLHDSVVDDTPPSWSPDGRRLAFVAAGNGQSRVSEIELASGALLPLTDGTHDVFAPAYDPTGAWLSYEEVDATDAGPQRVVRAIDRRTRTTTEVVGPQPMSSTDHWARKLIVDEWTAAGRLALSLGEETAFFTLFDGSFELDDVPLSAGENVLVARSTHRGSGLVSADSAAVSVTVSGMALPDLAVSAASLVTYPTVPVIGRAASVTARVANVGAAAAPDVVASLGVLDAAGRVVLSRELALGEIGPGEVVPVSVAWVPAAAGEYVLSLVVDPAQQIDELNEDDDAAEAGVSVVAAGGVVSARVAADRSAYAAATTALVSVTAINAGPSVSGTLRTTVEDASGATVALLDERSVSLGYGEKAAFSLRWDTGRSYAGAYLFQLRLIPEEGEPPVASAAFPFVIAPDLTLAARLVPRQTRVEAGSVTALDARIENRGTNSPLLNAVARLRILPAGPGEPVVFEGTLPIATLLPGGLWTGSFGWPVEVVAGSYDAELTVVRADEPALVTAHAAIQVMSESSALAGTLALQPANVLAGDGTEALLTLTNRGGVPASGLPVSVEVVQGETAASLKRAALTLDLGPGETRSVSTPLETNGLAPGAYPVFLRTAEPAKTLARASLRVHGAIAPPSIDAPAAGARVTTSHPTLTVTNASSAEAAPLVYEFEIYADTGLTAALPGVQDVPGAAERTSWTVATNLGEDQTFYWRARATDGFSTSAWTDVAAFTVDVERVPPQAPVPESPQAGERVAVREPTLVVRNAFDPDSAVLSYEFRLASDPELTAIVASAVEVPAGVGFTSWRVPVTLDEDTSYYWCARARDESGVSPWSAATPFSIDSVSEPPTAPVPVAPALAARVAALSPSLVVQNARDPEGQPLSYRFQIDRAASFDSPDLQEANGIPETADETAWTPPRALSDHTGYSWRAAASDGVSYGPWGASTFTVNLANEAPEAPAPLAPANGQVATTLTPELRVRNASDPDHDALRYEFRVTDAAEREVAATTGVEEGAVETGWTLPTPLVENGSYAWSARAHDAELAGPWTPAWRFRVNTVQEPPSAPTLVAPSEGAVLDERRPALVVDNATSPDGASLSYRFELSRLAADGTLAVVERASGIPEGSGTTAFTPSAELDDGSYSWTARAEDAAVPGPWMASAHFRVAVDRPPAAPTGVAAAAGDARIDLTWRASPEPDVVGYRVYRSRTSGGDYALVAETTAPRYSDLGLANGVTEYYVVTARDERSESGFSAEVAATPRAPTTIEAEVRTSPDRIVGECLFSGDCRKGRSVATTLADLGSGPTCAPEPGPSCPSWLLVAIELSAGDAATIDRATVRLAGRISPDPGYFALRDDDHDRRSELQLRFSFDRIAALLHAGANTFNVTGRAQAGEFRGVARVSVLPLDVSLRLTPRTLTRRSLFGEDVTAQLGFHCVDPGRVEKRSLWLNGAVPAAQVLSDHGGHLIAKFDRKAVVKVLPKGDNVRVEIRGNVAGFPFAAVDHIRVTE
jgi:flagellar hook assembly protein FlgD/Tol biopolymer transport system component